MSSYQIKRGLIINPFGTLQVVVVRVLSHTSIHKGPGEIVHSILLILYGLSHHLSVEMVVKELVQVRLQDEVVISHDHTSTVISHTHLPLLGEARRETFCRILSLSSGRVRQLYHCHR